MVLRAPLSPGTVGRNAPSPVEPWGSGKIFTEPSGFFLVPVTAGRSGVALGAKSQSVGQALPLRILSGKPDVQRAKPESCQPPITASRDLPAFLPTTFPLPKGNSTIQLALIWCGVSKSETPRSCFGLQAFWINPSAWTCKSTRSASDSRSIDLEYV